MRKVQLLFVPVLLLVSAGCRRVQLPSATESHPASPCAASAPAVELSEVLEVDKDTAPRVPPEMKESPTQMEHKM